MRELIVFSNEWFAYHQAKLLRFANSRFGRYVLRIHGDRSAVGKNRIIQLQPHALTWQEGDQLKTEFRTHSKYSKRLYYAFKPVWWLLHAWDIGIANKLNYALNVGFDTLTAYPNSHPESDSVDGYVGRDIAGSETFATIRAGAGNSSNDADTTAAVILEASATLNQFAELYRGVTLFNTSSIGATATISDATLSLYGFSKDNELGSTNLDIVSSSPASSTAISDSDYANFGTTVLGTITFDDYTVGAYNAITLNSDGLANISKTSISRFGQRLAWDTAGAFTGSWISASDETEYFWYSADRSGTTRDPKLTVTYAILPYATYATGAPYGSGKLMYQDSGSWTDISGGDLYFTTYTTEGSTTVPHLSEDPGEIMQSIIDSNVLRGGVVNYDGATIGLTFTTVSYTFNTQTILEAINKVLELAPDNWYWYVDPGTSTIYFQEKNASADHTLTFGKHIKNIEIEKRIEGIVNTVYFTGGDTGGGNILYRKYQDTDSVGLYGIRAIRYVDQRVTLSATADTIASRIISRGKSPEIRLRLEVADNNITDSEGYDIESINVGDVINIRNVKGSTGSSLWDVAQWDSDRWDYNISALSSMYLQVVRREYSPNKLMVICSTLPPDVNKRIEDINRNLEVTQTVDNPDTPE